MRKIIIYAILAALVLTIVPAVNAEVQASADIDITDLEYAIETDQGDGTLYVWWKTNAAAKDCEGLQVNVSVDGSIIGTTDANTHLSLGNAWTFDEFNTVFGEEGTYTLKVAFIDFSEPDGSNQAKNDVERTITVGESILNSISQGLYDVFFAIDQAVDSTGMDILDDIPFLPVIIVIVLIVVVYLIYKKYKKKKARGRQTVAPYRQRNVSINTTTRYPPYGNPPNQKRYYDDYGNEF